MCQLVLWGLKKRIKIGKKEKKKLDEICNLSFTFAFRKRRKGDRMLPSITTYSWLDGHFISISVYGVWGVRIRVQVFRKELYTHIHLD